MSFVLHKFTVPNKIVNNIKSKTPKFGYNGLGELVYARTYARKKPTSGIENWNDTILRVVGGTFSILKSHMIKNHLRWDEDYWNNYAEGFADYMFDFKYLPAGRGLFSIGSPIIDKIGAIPANNCGFVSTVDLVKSATWAMDCLMLGAGIGFDTKFEGKLTYPTKKNRCLIDDSREGWVDSVRLLLESFLSNETTYNNNNSLPIFDYSSIRAAGVPLKTFGGVSSGSAPLIKLHKRMKTYLFTKVLHNITVEKFGKKDYNIQSDLNKHVVFILNEIRSLDDDNNKEYFSYCLSSYQKYSNTRLIADIFNSIGACIVAGNLRRSAQIILGNTGDQDFIDLKNYNVNPERTNISWMSNNSLVLEKKEDFIKYIPIIAKRLVDGNNGEPGIINMLNIKKFGRVNKKYDPEDQWTREREQDKAIGVNPCSEINLESYELCNIADVFPPKCINEKGEFDENVFYKAIEYATFYCSVVSLLPTHSEDSNAVISRNHRIGVGLSGTAQLTEKIGYPAMISLLRTGYKKIREINSKTMDMAGVKKSIRCSTIKPSGSISQLAGTSAGIHFPICSRFIIRRIRIAANSDLVPYLIKNGINYETDSYSDNTLVFEFPVDQGEGVRTINDVSMFEQLKVAEMYQANYADNSISVTINYDKEEAKYLEQAIALSIPNLKCLSFLPKNDVQYKQAPYESITEERYNELIKKMGKFDLSEYTNSLNNSKTEVESPKFCDAEKCQI